MVSYHLTGEKIKLRALEESDIDGPYLDWLNDPDVTRFMTAGIFPQTKEMLRNFYKSISGAQTCVYYAILDKATDKHIGNIKLDHIDWINRRAEIGVLVGDRNFWGRGVCKEAVGLVTEYAFKKLDLRKIMIWANTENTAAVRCYKSNGYKEEGRLREMNYNPDSGKYDDHICLALFKDEWVKRK
ncbi:MAG: GNAT family N-acetyltransferase [Candidatus Altiarchaeota archaeon]|nr:GNAT family N-acetyltransferase [Candidatus Altiarchaeota archaeon]